MPRNNSQLKLFAGFFPVVDWEVYDVDKEIWKAKPLPGTEQDTALGDVEIYFSRLYQPDINDADKLFVEVELPEGLFGLPALLVPIGKLLFGRTADSIILQPKISTPKSIGGMGLGR